MMCGERSSRAVGCVKNGCLLLLSALLILAAPLTSWSQGLTPDSPRVKAMAKKGIEFLNGYVHNAGMGKAHDHMDDIGGRALRALAIAKYHDVYKIPGGKSNRHVAAALKECREAIKAKSKLLGSPGDYGHRLYAASIALILLCEVDPKNSEREIDFMVDFLLSRQLPNGGWTYDQLEKLGHGDVSQTQYVILALWTAKHVGASIPDGAIIKACRWLMRTQEGAGSWGYMPNDGGGSQPYRNDKEGPLLAGENPDQTRYTNHNLAPSLAAAGLSSLYITAGMLQFVPAEPVAIEEKKNKHKTLQAHT